MTEPLATSREVGVMSFFCGLMLGMVVAFASCSGPHDPPPPPDTRQAR